MKEILELAKAAKVPFLVGYQRRCDRNFRALRDMIAEGSLGGPGGPGSGVRMVKCTSRDNPVPPLAYLKTSGGLFHDMLSHDFDMIHFLSGGQIPEEVFTVAHCYDPAIRKLDDVDTVVVTLRYRSGLLATVDCSRTAEYGYDQRVEVFGERGMLTAHNEVRHTVELATGAGHLRPCTEWSFPERYRHTYTVELSEFVAMARARPMLCEPDALVDRHVMLGDVATAAEMSWREGRNVKLSEVSGAGSHASSKSGGSKTGAKRPAASSKGGGKKRRT